MNPTSLSEMKKAPSLDAFPFKLGPIDQQAKRQPKPFLFKSMKQQQLRAEKKARRPVKC
jgi:hypothetical protein